LNPPRKTATDGDGERGKCLIGKCRSNISWQKAVQHLRHPRPTDAEVAGKCGTVLEPAGVEKRLVVAGSFEGITAFFLGRFSLRFGFQKGVPGENGDDGRST